MFFFPRSDKKCNGIVFPESNTRALFQEASHYRPLVKPSQICDIQATYDHLKTLQKSIPAKAFEILVKNITCHRYKYVHDLFVIPYKRKGKRWDWIRNKRSLKLHFYNKDEHTSNDEAYVVNFEDDCKDSFERFAKGDDGIYKIVTRRKRTANLESLQRGLRNIPNLTPGVVRFGLLYKLSTRIFFSKIVNDARLQATSNLVVVPVTEHVGR